MAAKSAYEVFMEDPANQRLMAQEDLILELTECIWRVMEKEGVSRAELAERLGKSKSFVTQALDGNRNMTIRTFADFMFMLGHTAKVHEVKLTEQFTSDVGHSGTQCEDYDLVIGKNFYKFIASPPISAYRNEQENGMSAWVVPGKTCDKNKPCFELIA